MRVPKGCPLCMGDVMGSKETGFFCQACNLIFKKQHVVYRHTRNELKELIDLHFGEYGMPQRPSERERLLDADHRIELIGGLRKASTSVHDLRRAIEDAKQLVKDAQEGKLPEPITLQEALAKAPAPKQLPKAPKAPVSPSKANVQPKKAVKKAPKKGPTKKKTSKKTLKRAPIEKSVKNSPAKTTSSKATLKKRSAQSQKSAPEPKRRSIEDII